MNEGISLPIDKTHLPQLSNFLDTKKCLFGFAEFIRIFIFIHTVILFIKFLDLSRGNIYIVFIGPYNCYRP